MSEVVALLLDDAMPAERLGALLRSARKRRGLSRKEAAAAAGTTPGKLRRYERGEKPVPAGVCAQLAECYGEDLTAHVPLRMPPQITDRSVVIGDMHRPVGPNPEDVIAGYVDIVHRLRDSEPGDPLALRSADIFALAGALGADRDEIEARIAEVLGCTRTEARRLHGELLRRKVILPVAGLAAGMAAFAGAAYAVHTPASSTTVRTQSIVATEPSTTSSTVLRHPAEKAPRVTTTTVLHVVADTTSTTLEDVAVDPTPPSTVEQQQSPDATVPPAEVQPDVPVSIAPPVANPADPPVSVLPGETPITVIGGPDSTNNTP